MRDSELTRPVMKKSIEIVSRYLNGKLADEDRVKIAMLAINAHVKLLGTEANDDTNKLGLAKMIYSDPKLRETYIKKSMPHMITDK